MPIGANYRSIITSRARYEYLVMLLPVDKERKTERKNKEGRRRRDNKGGGKTTPARIRETRNDT
jgi:hypothetical protein